MASTNAMIAAVALGVGSGFLRKMDVDKGRTKLTNQWGTYAEAGAAVVGLMAGSYRIPLDREVGEAFLYSGLALTSERVTRSARSGDFGSGAPASIAGRSYIGAGAPYARASAFSTKEPSATIF